MSIKNRNGRTPYWKQDDYIGSFEKYWAMKMSVCINRNGDATTGSLLQERRDPKRLLEQTRERRKANPDAFHARQRRYYKQWRNKNPLGSYKNHLKARYGITLEEYDILFASQNGLCAICQTAPPKSSRHNLLVDHNQITGKVRGLLCQPCNSHVIGLVDIDPTVLARIINYIR